MLMPPLGLGADGARRGWERDRHVWLAAAAGEERQGRGTGPAPSGSFRVLLLKGVGATKRDVLFVGMMRTEAFVSLKMPQRFYNETQEQCTCQQDTYSSIVNEINEEFSTENYVCLNIEIFCNFCTKFIRAFC